MWPGVLVVRAGRREESSAPRKQHRVSFAQEPPNRGNRGRLSISNPTLKQRKEACRREGSGRRDGRHLSYTSVCFNRILARERVENPDYGEPVSLAIGAVRTRSPGEFRVNYRLYGNYDLHRWLQGNALPKVL